jgi:hypothetical protein
VLSAPDNIVAVAQQGVVRKLAPPTPGPRPERALVAPVTGVLP